MISEKSGGEGFEPSIRLTTANGFRDRRDGRCRRFRASAGRERRRSRPRRTPPARFAARGSMGTLSVSLCTPLTVVRRARSPRMFGFRDRCTLKPPRASILVTQQFGNGGTMGSRGTRMLTPLSCRLSTWRVHKPASRPAGSFLTRAEREGSSCAGSGSGGARGRGACARDVGGDGAVERRRAAEGRAPLPGAVEEDLHRRPEGGPGEEHGGRRAERPGRTRLQRRRVGSRGLRVRRPLGFQRLGERLEDALLPVAAENGVAVVDVSDPANPDVVSRLVNPTGTPAEDVTVFQARFGPLAGRDIAQRSACRSAAALASIRALRAG